MQLFEDIKKVKFYTIFCVLVFGVWFWASATGRKLIGDDNESKETATTTRSSHTNRFYHK